MWSFKRMFDVGWNNEIDRFARTIFKTLLRDADKKSGLRLNYDGIVSYVVAEIDFLNLREDTAPDYKLLYKEVMDNVRKRQTYRDFLLRISEYYHGNPNLTSALYSMTRTYMQSVWEINDDRLNNPIELTAYSYGFTGLRVQTVKHYKDKMLKVMIE